MSRIGSFASSKRVLLVFVLFLACFAISVCWKVAHTAPTSSVPAFDREQHVILQIVTAPSRSVVGGIEYDEKATIVHTSHELTIPASGDGMSIHSVVDGIPINVTFSSAERGEDAASIVLHDLRFRLPLRIRTSDHSGIEWWGFSESRTVVSAGFHDFRRGLTLHYNGENLPNTFMRMRVDPAIKPLPEIDVTTVKPAG